MSGWTMLVFMLVQTNVFYFAISTVQECGQSCVSAGRRGTMNCNNSATWDNPSKPLVYWQAPNLFYTFSWHYYLLFQVHESTVDTDYFIMIPERNSLTENRCSLHRTKIHSFPLNTLKRLSGFVTHDSDLKNVRYTPKSRWFNSYSKLFDTTWDLSSTSG